MTLQPTSWNADWWNILPRRGSERKKQVRLQIRHGRVGRGAQPLPPPLPQQKDKTSSIVRDLKSLAVIFLLICLSRSGCFLILFHASVLPIRRETIKAKKLRKARILFSHVLRDSTPRYVGRSVGRSHFYFFSVFELFEHTAPAQMP